MQFDGLVRHFEFLRMGERTQDAVEGLAGCFVNGAASVADHQNGLMLRVWMMAANERVQTLDAMNQPMCQEEIKCAINGWRLDQTAFTRESCNQIIGFRRLVVRPDFRQHGAPNGG